MSCQSDSQASVSEDDTSMILIDVIGGPQSNMTTATTRRQWEMAAVHPPQRLITFLCVLLLCTLSTVRSQVAPSTCDDPAWTYIEVTEWTPWGACDDTVCGASVRSRSRQCLYFVGGDAFEEPIKETRTGGCTATGVCNNNNIAPKVPVDSQ